MTPAILARRRAEAQATIVAKVETLAARFGVDASALTSAPRTRDSLVTDMFGMEAVAGILTEIDVATVPPDPTPSKAKAEKAADSVEARTPGPPAAPPSKK